MENNFTEIKVTTYGENVKNSFGGVIFGIILFFASFFYYGGMKEIVFD